MDIANALINIESIIRSIDVRELYRDRHGQYNFKRAIERIVDSRIDSFRDVINREDNLLRDRKATNRANAEAKATEWAEKNLQIGQMIKVVGTRDGHGIRLVLNIDHDNKSVECRQIGARPYFYRGEAVIEHLPYLTTHNFGKVRGIVELVDTGRPMNPLFTDKLKGPIRTRGEWKISNYVLQK